MRSTLANLPKDKRGRTIPWFVTETNEKGEPDFVHIHPTRPTLAWAKDLCWICGGGLLNSKRSFVMGPMSLFSRICTEPPMHLDCARFAVQTCPFMLNPRRKRADTDIQSPGVPLDRNPGVNLIYRASSFKVRPEDGGLVYLLGSPHRIEAWKEGRRATFDEFRESVETGIAELATKMDLGPDFYGLVPGVLELGRDATSQACASLAAAGGRT